MKHQVLYKNVLEYNVYHCCLCNFLDFKEATLIKLFDCFLIYDFDLESIF